MHMCRGTNTEKGGGGGGETETGVFLVGSETGGVFK